jgi:hypothetical protein
MMRSTTHSKEIGASLMRGARTTSHGAFWSPSASNSSTEESNSAADRCTRSASGRTARFVTNSPVSRMLTKVSLSVCPSERGCSEIETIGGLRPTAVKNETGAILPTPSLDTVLTQAIARGKMLPISSLYAAVASSPLASMII